jgi:hypothetical protein
MVFNTIITHKFVRLPNYLATMAMDALEVTIVTHIVLIT